MHEKEYFFMNYKPRETVRSAVRWQQIAAQYGTKKSFNKVMKSLRKRGYVTDWGKSDQVYALTIDGIKAVR